MPTRTNTFEDWLINGGPMPGFELPEVPLPDSVTLCRNCGEIMKDPAAAIHDYCKQLEALDTLSQMAEDRYRDDT